MGFVPFPPPGSSKETWDRYQREMLLVTIFGLICFAIAFGMIVWFLVVAATSS